MMQNAKDHTAEDINEEVQAATRIINHLDGKPIVKTSGDENHTININSVGIKIGMTDSGDELAVIVTQKDRHHPHLVYDTVKEELAKLPELKDYTPKALHVKHDYNHETGEMTLRYEIPSGKADDIIHDLSKNQQAKTPFATDFQASPEQLAASNDPSWVMKTAIDKTLAFFTGRS